MAGTEEIGFRLNVESGNAEKSVGSFKKELREAKAAAVDAARSFGEFSPQAIEAAKKFAALNDTLKDTNELAGVLAGPDKFRAFANLAGGIAGGFAAVQGAIGLVGEESEELQKTLLKVNSAIALSNGLSQVADLGKFFGQAKAALLSFEAVQKINNATTSAAAKIQKAFTGEVAATSTGFKVLKGAIAATGIGLLVVAVGEIVANFDKLKKAVLNLIPGLAKVGEFFSSIIDAATDFIGLTSEATRAEDDLRKKIGQTNIESDRALQLAQASGATSKEVRALKNQQYDDEIAKLKEIQRLTGGTDEDAKRLEELEFNKKILAAENAREEREAAEAAKKKAEEDRKRRAEEAKKRAEERRKEIEEETELENRIRLQAQQEAEDELRAKQEAERQRKANEKQGLNTAVANLKANIASDLQAEQEVRDEIALESEARDLELLQRKYDRLRAAAAGNESLLTAITESESAARTDIQKKWADIEFQQKQDQVVRIGGLLNTASQVVGRNTAVGKGIAAAGATIDTYRGATAALAATAGAGPFAAALAIAQAALIVGNGIKSVRQILATQVPGGNSGQGATPSFAAASAGGSAPAVSTAPTLSGIQSTLIDQTRRIANNSQNQKAFVVESEITEKQERARAIQQSASF